MLLDVERARIELEFVSAKPNLLLREGGIEQATTVKRSDLHKVDSSRSVRMD